jgi:hypothetical protein
MEGANGFTPETLFSCEGSVTAWPEEGGRSLSCADMPEANEMVVGIMALWRKAESAG